MGSFILNLSIQENNSSCLVAVKVARSRERQSLGRPGLASNSLWDVFIVCCARVTMLNVSVLVHPSTWPLSWSTSQLRSLSWQVMLPGITRRPELSQDIFNSLSEMTRN